MSRRRWLAGVAVVAGLAAGRGTALAEPANNIQQQIELQKKCNEAASHVGADCSQKGRDLYDAGLQKAEDAAPLAQTNTGQAMALTQGAGRDFSRAAKECKDGSEARKLVGSCVAWATEQEQVLQRYLTKIQELGRQPGAR
ncbi:MAG: hypothetical protein IPK07_07485 [Deltaproteobacteria bacterium]|nr:hypothetical protein [Deltaproteobacteria bacterium]